MPDCHLQPAGGAEGLQEPQVRPRQVRQPLLGWCRGHWLSSAFSAYLGFGQVLCCCAGLPGPTVAPFETQPLCPHSTPLPCCLLHEGLPLITAVGIIRLLGEPGHPQECGLCLSLTGIIQKVEIGVPGTLGMWRVGQSTPYLGYPHGKRLLGRGSPHAVAQSCHTAPWTWGATCRLICCWQVMLRGQQTPGPGPQGLRGSSVRSLGTGDSRLYSRTTGANACLYPAPVRDSCTDLDMLLLGQVAFLPAAASRFLWSFHFLLSTVCCYK